MYLVINTLYLKSLKLCKLIITSLILRDWCLKALNAKAKPLGSNARFVLSVPTKCQNYNAIWRGGPSYILCALCDSRDFIIRISVNLSGRKKNLKYGSKILLLMRPLFLSVHGHCSQLFTVSGMWLSPLHESSLFCLLLGILTRNKLEKWRN